MRRRGLSRRAMLKGAAASSSALSLGLWLPSAAAQSAPLRSGVLTPGVIIMLTDYILTNKLDEKHGLKFAEPKIYSTLSTVQGDFVAGAYEIGFGGWDAYALRYLAGVPCELLGTFSTGTMLNMLAPANGAKTLAELKGKTLAAPLASSTYKISSAVIREFEGIDLEKHVQIQSSDNPMAPLSMLMADRADAALSWETSISAALLRRPDLKVIYNVGEAYKAKTGRDLPYFGMAVRKELTAKDPTIGAKLNRVFKDCIDGINANTAAAIESAGKNTYLPPEVLKLAFSSGRMRFSYISALEDEGRKTFLAASEFLTRNGIFSRAIDKGFFVSS